MQFIDDPVLFADVALPLCKRDIDRTIATVKNMKMDNFFTLAVVRELEKRRSLET